MIGLLCVAY